MRIASSNTIPRWRPEVQADFGTHVVTFHNYSFAGIQETMPETGQTESGCHKEAGESEMTVYAPSLLPFLPLSVLLFSPPSLLLSLPSPLSFLSPPISFLSYHLSSPPPSSLLPLLFALLLPSLISPPSLPPLFLPLSSLSSFFLLFGSSLLLPLLSFSPLPLSSCNHCNYLSSQLLKSTREKQAKSKSSDETAVKKLEDQQRAELLAFERKATVEVGVCHHILRL